MNLCDPVLFVEDRAEEESLEFVRIHHVVDVDAELELDFCARSVAQISANQWDKSDELHACDFDEQQADGRKDHDAVLGRRKVRYRLLGKSHNQSDFLYVVVHHLDVPPELLVVLGVDDQLFAFSRLHCKRVFGDFELELFEGFLLVHVLDEGEERVPPERLEQLVGSGVTDSYSFDLTEETMKFVGLSAWIVSFNMSISGSASLTSKDFSGTRIKMLFSE